MADEIQLGVIVTLVWNTLIFAASAWLLFTKIDKRLSLIEDRIHNNGFAPKAIVNDAVVELHELRRKLAHLSTRLTVIETTCTREHGTSVSIERDI